MILSEIRHTARYYLAFIKASLSKSMAYRSDFWATFLANYSYNAVILVFLFTLFSKIDAIAGWTKYEIILIFGIGQILYYTYYTFFQSVNYIAGDILSGKLDLQLGKPIRAIFKLLSSEFKLFETIPGLILASGIIGFALTYTGIYSTRALVLGCVFMLFSVLFNIVVKLAIQLLAFWELDITELDSIFEKFSDRAHYPIDIYPKRFRYTLSTIIPAVLLSYVPAYLITRGFNFTLLALYFGSFFGFTLLTYILWKKGLKVYSSASS